MLDIPPLVSITFFFELIACTIYFFFNLFLTLSKQAFLRTPFFKLIHATGFAGIGVVSTYWLINLFLFLPVLRGGEWLIFVGQISNGATTFCYTTGKFLILLNRLAVLHNIRFAKTGWTNKKTNLVIFCQYTIPLVPHFYFAFAPVNWTGERYYGWDNTTGSIYRSITGTYYALYACVGMTMNVIAYRRLQKLSFSSATLYKQQRSLSIYTMSSASFHMIFSIHQMVWSYAFLSGNSEMLASVRNMRPFIQDFTTFMDPIVLICVSKQVRNAMRKMHIPKSAANCLVVLAFPLQLLSWTYFFITETGFAVFMLVSVLAHLLYYFRITVAVAQMLLLLSEFSRAYFFAPQFWLFMLSVSGVQASTCYALYSSAGKYSALLYVNGWHRPRVERTQSEVVCKQEDARFKSELTTAITIIAFPSQLIFYVFFLVNLSGLSSKLSLIFLILLLSFSVIVHALYLELRRRGEDQYTTHFFYYEIGTAFVQLFILTSDWVFFYGLRSSELWFTAFPLAVQVLACACLFFDNEAGEKPYLDENTERETEVFKSKEEVLLLEPSDEDA